MTFTRQASPRVHAGTLHRGREEQEPSEEQHVEVVKKGSALGGSNPDVGIIWTSWAVTVAGVTAAAGSARPVTITVTEATTASA